MKMLKSALVLLLFLSLKLSAQVEMKEYVVDISEEGGAIPVMLVRSKFEEYQNSLIEFGENLESCSTSSSEMINPFIAKSINYNLVKSSMCRVRAVFYDRWEFNCLLPSKIHIALGKSLLNRARTDNAVSDFSLDEKAILFSSGYCRHDQI